MTTCNHCLGSGCVHCKERRAEMALQRRRSLLTDNERRALGLFGRPLRLRRQSFRPTAPVIGAHRMTPVLPADFILR